MSAVSPEMKSFRKFSAAAVARFHLDPEDAMRPDVTAKSGELRIERFCEDLKEREREDAKFYSLFAFSVKIRDIVLLHAPTRW